MHGQREPFSPDPAAAPPPSRLRLALASEDETRRMGAALAPALRAGDVVALSGGLGAGKSALARAVIRALLRDPEHEVPSPSYTLVNVHAADDADAPEIWHADLYRLAGAEEAAELGLAEAGAHAILLIEWPERMGAGLPARRLCLALAIAGEQERAVSVAAHGPGWEAALEALAAWS